MAKALPILCVAALIGWGAVVFPIAPVAVLAGLAALAALLWRAPHLWLVALPAVLPVVDLSPFTGWLLVGEADAMVLVVLAVLWARTTPARGDLWPAGWPGAVLAAFVASMALGLALGLNLPGPGEGTDNIYLSPWNAVRLAKPVAYGLALLPFLRQRQRQAGDAAALFATGMLIGLCGIALLVGLERLAFPGLFNLTSDYRVAAAFASMHVGGGHIGAWLAAGLPFLAVPLLRGRAVAAACALLVGVGATHALAVTFARTAYAAALVGIAVTGLLLLLPRRAGAPATRRATPLAVLALALAGTALVATARETAFMASRLAHLGPDLSERVRNWTAGLDLRAPGAVPLLFGMGLGTYPRLLLAGGAMPGPSNLVLERDAEGPWLRLIGRGPFYVGQKVKPRPGEVLRVRLRLRGESADAALTFGLCEKWLLYSDACASATVRPSRPGAWEEVAARLTAPGTDRFPPRPVEFWLHAHRGGSVAVRDIRLTDAGGRERIANGGFTAGTARWLFTDDQHGAWRIFNQYLTALFETGLLGLAAFLALLCGAIGRAWTAARGGHLAWAPVAGALCAFAVSCLADAPLEAPRLATMFLVLAGLALAAPHPAAGTGGATQPHGD